MFIFSKVKTFPSTVAPMSIFLKSSNKTLETDFRIIMHGFGLEDWYVILELFLADLTDMFINTPSQSRDAKGKFMQRFERKLWVYCTWIELCTPMNGNYLETDQVGSIDSSHKCSSACYEQRLSLLKKLGVSTNFLCFSFLFPLEIYLAMTQLWQGVAVCVPCLTKYKSSHSDMSAVFDVGRMWRTILASSENILWI